MHHLETLIQAIPPAVFAAGGSLNGHNGVSPSPVDTNNNPHASFASSTHAYPSGVPPPSLATYSLINPSTYFAPSKSGSRHASPNGMFGQPPKQTTPDQLAEETARMSLSASYLYFDDEGYTRWQGETSGLPILDLLVERHKVVTKQDPDQPPPHPWAVPEHASVNDWFPDRTPRRTDANPEVIWKLVTSFIAPDLMDRYVYWSIFSSHDLTLNFQSSLVQCYLSTSYYLMPFLHVPSFLAVRPLSILPIRLF